MRAHLVLLAAMLLAPLALAAELEIEEGGYVVSDDLSLLPDAVRVNEEVRRAYLGEQEAVTRHG